MTPTITECEMRTPRRVFGIRRGLNHSLRESSIAAYKSALSRGELKRPSTCEECGRRKRRIHGHHEDYAKPLEVKWLCAACHRAKHGSEKTPNVLGKRLAFDIDHATYARLCAHAVACDIPVRISVLGFVVAGLERFEAEAKAAHA